MERPWSDSWDCISWALQFSPLSPIKKPKTFDVMVRSYLKQMHSFKSLANTDKMKIILMLLSYGEFLNGIVAVQRTKNKNVVFINWRHVTVSSGLDCSVVLNTRDLDFLHVWTKSFWPTPVVWGPALKALVSYVTGGRWSV